VKAFDPVALRTRLLGECGIEFHLRRKLEDFQAAGALASGADADIDKSVQCFLVGLDDAARQLLEKAHDWLRLAVATKEIPQRHVPDGTEASRFHILAMCNWLLHGVHDLESLNRFVVHEDRFLVSSGLEKDRVEISFLSPSYLDAGAYKRALELIDNARGLVPPKDLRSIRNEGQMAHVLCGRQLGLASWSDSAVASAIGAFLNRKMNDWLIDGHWGRAAEWLKIVYWKEGKAGLSPKETLLKAYKHLPRFRADAVQA
jgi:hypothetical protein